MSSEKGKLPIRSFMEDPDIKWRYGKKPIYTDADKLWMETKSCNHAADSLETVVENLVKTWEMEASHKVDPNDWGTIVKDIYQISANDSPPVKIEENLRVGNYNVLLKDQSPLYDASKKTFEESHDIFRTTFEGRFPWEVLKVHSGPPQVVFDWRHWAYVVGEYRNSQGSLLPPSKEKVEMFGYCIVTVNSELKIEELKVYYDPQPFLEALERGEGTTEIMKESCLFEMSKHCPLTRHN